MMIYSEFGRLVGDNARHGTDHGTAAPHLMMGGRIKGDLSGMSHSLTDLQGGSETYARLSKCVYDRD